MNIEEIKCECCKKKVEKFGNRKFCNNCSRYTLELRKKISSYKRRFLIVNKKLYGTENGAERIRSSQSD